MVCTTHSLGHRVLRLLLVPDMTTSLEVQRLAATRSEANAELPASSPECDEDGTTHNDEESIAAALPLRIERRSAAVFESSWGCKDCARAGRLGDASHSSVPMQSIAAQPRRVVGILVERCLLWVEVLVEGKAIGICAGVSCIAPAVYLAGWLCIPIVLAVTFAVAALWNSVDGMCIEQTEDGGILVTSRTSLELLWGPRTWRYLPRRLLLFLLYSWELMYHIGFGFVGMLFAIVCGTSSWTALTTLSASTIDVVSVDVPPFGLISVDVLVLLQQTIPCMLSNRNVAFVFWASCMLVIVAYSTTSLYPSMPIDVSLDAPPIRILKRCAIFIEYHSSCLRVWRTGLFRVVFILCSTFVFLACVTASSLSPLPTVAASPGIPFVYSNATTVSLLFGAHPSISSFVVSYAVSIGATIICAAISCSTLAISWNYISRFVFQISSRCATTVASPSSRDENAGRITRSEAHLNATDSEDIVSTASNHLTASSAAAAKRSHSETTALLLTPRSRVNDAVSLDNNSQRRENEHDLASTHCLPDLAASSMRNRVVQFLLILLIATGCCCAYAQIGVLPTSNNVPFLTRGTASFPSPFPLLWVQAPQELVNDMQRSLGAPHAEQRCVFFSPVMGVTAGSRSAPHTPKGVHRAIAVLILCESVLLWLFSIGKIEDASMLLVGRSAGEECTEADRSSRVSDFFEGVEAARQREKAVAAARSTTTRTAAQWLPPKKAGCSRAASNVHTWIAELAAKAHEAAALFCSTSKGKSSPSPTTGASQCQTATATGIFDFLRNEESNAIRNGTLRKFARRLLSLLVVKGSLLTVVFAACVLTVSQHGGSIIQAMMWGGGPVELNFVEAEELLHRIMSAFFGVCGVCVCPRVLLHPSLLCITLPDAPRSSSYPRVVAAVFLLLLGVGCVGVGILLLYTVCA